MIKYLTSIVKLNTSKNKTHYTYSTKYQAPHKPILLLCLMDLIAQGNPPVNFFELTPDLIELFRDYWELVMPVDRRPNISMPFFHLRSDNIWHLQPRPEFEQTINTIPTISSVSKIHEVLLGAKLSDDLYQELTDPDIRNRYRQALIETYFAKEFHDKLFARSVENLEIYQYSLDLQERVSEDKPTINKDVPIHVRDSGFRKAIITVYEHRCAFCGVRMLTPEGHTAVIAAHIKPWYLFHDDDIRNGVALCHLCHWSFDKGLLGLSEEYTIMASQYLRKEKNLPGHLLTLADRKIMGPEKDYFWPLKENILWHHKKIFVK